MSNIDELHQRISAAMDRVAYGITQMSAAGDGDAESLRAQLEEEKTANAQLEERLRAQKEKLAAAEAAAAQMGETKAKVNALDLELQRLRQANQQLREANAALREANEAGVAEPHLINKSMLAELEALRATRAADMAEADAILSALAPVLAGADQEESAHA